MGLTRTLWISKISQALNISDITLTKALFALGFR